jgi:hypothetical protein
MLAVSFANTTTPELIDWLFTFLLLCKNGDVTMPIKGFIIGVHID